MNSTTPALIVAAAGVGFGHAILPDHWLPLAIVGRARRYPFSRLARLSSLAGLAHVLVSLLLGAVIVAVGLQLRSTVEHVQNTIVGGILVATGIAFLVLELSGRGHSHAHGDGARHRHDPRGRDRPTDAAPGHDHEQIDDDPATEPGLAGLAGIMVPFGAAASPDLTILPVFLASTAAGLGTAVGSLIAFAVVTISTIVGLTLLATFGGYQIGGSWLERWGNGIIATTLIIIGSLVLGGVI